MSKHPMTFDEISDIIRAYLVERDWHTQSPRSLAISIVLEAGELLEHFQWNEQPVGGASAIGEELADIFIYAFNVAQTYDIDLPQEIIKKLDKAKAKYPAKNFKGKAGTKRDEVWLKAKLNHKKEGL